MKLSYDINKDDILESWLRNGWVIDKDNYDILVNTMTGQKKSLNDELKKYGIENDKE